MAAVLVRRPVTITMLFLTLLGTGVMAYRKIPLTLLPKGLSSSSLSVRLPYPGAGPKEVEDQLTRVVEDEIRTIPGIEEIFSVSSEGGSDITIEFGPNADMDVAYGEVRDRIERVRGMLPSEMDRYRIRRWNSNTDMPVMWIGVQYDDEAEDPFGPIEDIVVPRLEGVDGVAQVSTSGVVDDAVRVFVDVARVAGYGIDLGEVIRTMQSDNFTLPAGQVDDGQRTYALRVDARFQSIDEIRRYPVGNGLVLSDIAEIVQARAYRDSVWRINGEAAVGMAVSRESDQNTIAVCERLEQRIDALHADPRLEGVTLNVFWNQKETILQSIDGLKGSALWGGLFAVIVLFFFLRDLRMTLLAAIAIPSSLLCAVMAVYFGGQTLNLISLAGFTLGIGMLVDNAVVVIENIARKRREGMTRLSAAGTGAGEVGLAVLTATLTSIVVFLPLVFMDGDQNTRVMMGEVGLPISWSLLASLLVALVFLPTFAARALSKRTPRPMPTTTRLDRVYERTLRWVLGHRFGAFLCLLVVMMIAQLAAGNLRASRANNEEGDGVTMMVDTPSNYTLTDTNGVFRFYEDWAESKMDEMSFDFFSARFDRRGGMMTFYPLETADEVTRANLPNLLRTHVPPLPGVELQVGWENAGGTELRIDMTGPDSEVLTTLAESLKDELAALTWVDDGVTKPLLDNVKTDLDSGLDEVHLRVDRERANELGVAPDAVRGMVAWGLGGQRLPDLALGDREIQVLIEYGQTDDESLDFLRNLGLYTDTGAVVPLASVASFDFDKALGALVRRNARTTMGVSAMPNCDNLFLVSREVDAVLANQPFPEGYSWTEEGGREQFEADMAELFSTLGFSVLLVYLLIAILLESVALPVSILVSILLAIMGVNLTLYLTDSAMGEMVGVGMVLLAGIVVNNAILLLDRVQHLRAAGKTRTEALVTGGRDRLRPILMTALTTIFGLMPMAVPQWFPGQTQGSGYEPMAITVAGGLAFSTFFTLLAVPLFYSWLDDVGRLFAGFSPWQRDRGSEGAPAGVPMAPRD
jgi:HAE1 family hydrophobic/amphiphilic exporter-1